MLLPIFYISNLPFYANCPIHSKFASIYHSIFTNNLTSIWYKRSCWRYFSYCKLASRSLSLKAAPKSSEWAISCCYFWIWNASEAWSSCSCYQESMWTLAGRSGLRAIGGLLASNYKKFIYYKIKSYRISPKRAYTLRLCFSRKISQIYHKPPITP